jgi:hypothetical protein
MTTSVKFFHSNMPGIPQLSGTAGALIDILTTCLVVGFGPKVVDSLVLSGGIATLNISTAHAFEPDTVILITGASPSGLNGEQRVLATTPTTVTFATGLSDQTATGSISCKYAPAGWEQPFSGTNLAVYRSTDISSTRLPISVNDTATMTCSVQGFESMSSVSVGTNPFPAAAGLWLKSGVASIATRPWTLVADGKTFWLYAHTAATGAGLAGVTYGFGDFASIKSGDMYGCALLSSPTSIPTQTTATTSALAHSSASNTATFAIARNYLGQVGPASGIKRAESYTVADAYSGASSGIVYPNPVDGSVLLRRIMVMESGPALRGVFRGPLFIGQSTGGFPDWLSRVPGEGDYSGRKMLAIPGAEPALTTRSPYVTLFDITGPWG